MAEQTLGEELFQNGWQQGALFSAPLLCFSWNGRETDPGAQQIRRLERKPKPDERFVLITQNCDIVAREDVEPFTEAMLCTVQKPAFVDKVGPNSARWFAVDPGRRLIAEAKYRLQIAKQLLTDLTPEPWPNTPEQLGRFVRWLARRYDRPDFPNAMAEHFERPLNNGLNRLAQDHPATFAAFNRSVREVRVSMPASDDPPFDLQVLLLLKDEGLSVEAANAIESAKEAIRSCLDPDLVQLEPDILTRTAEEMSLAEYLHSRPIFLEPFTYRGEEIDGAQPPERV